jgi:hypothetical protein
MPNRWPTRKMPLASPAPARPRVPWTMQGPTKIKLDAPAGPGRR